MFTRRSLFVFICLLVLMLNSGCRDQEAAPTVQSTSPPAATDTAQPQPTDTIAPSPTSPQPSLISVDDAALTPKVIGQNPARGEELDPDGYLEIYFDQPMNPEVTTAALRLVDNEGTAIDGETSWPQPRILRFKPNRQLKPNTSYQAILGQAAVSAAGNPLLEGLTLNFYTIGDLEVTQVSPAPDAQEVAIHSTITVIFNRPVVPLLIAEEQANLPHPLEITPATTGQGEWLNTSVYLFRPDGPLIGRETYTVRVLADVINQASATGAQLAADYDFQFTVTAPTYRYLNLVNRTTSPQDEYPHLPLDQSFQIIFEQPMDTATTEEAITLTPDEGTPTSLTFTWDDLQQTVTFTPTQLLQLGTHYTLNLSDEATSTHGGRLRQELTWHTTTALPPAIKGTVPIHNATQEQYSSIFRIDFVSRMDPDSMAGKVIIEPPPLGDPDGQYDRWDWSQRYYGLEPSTTYSVTILPGMTDVYGNPITEGRTLRFTTAPYHPLATFNFPDQLSFYRRDGSTAVWVTHLNVQQVDVSLYRITPAQFNQLLQWSTDGRSFMPDAAQLVWSQSAEVTADLNSKGYHRFDLVEEDDILAPGLYFITLDTPQIEHDFQHLQAQPLIMGTANLTLKTTTSESMIWLTDLTTGTPAADVPVAFYTPNNARVFEATTDSNGLVYVDDLNLDFRQQGWYYAITQDPDNEVFGFALQTWNDGVNPYDFGINTNYYLEQNKPTAYVYTERPVYRPGQEVSFKGIIRLNDDLNYNLPHFEMVRVLINTFNGSVFAENMPLSELGSFAGQFTLDEEATLGLYRITVEQGGNTIGNGRFDVAEYRKPTFQVLTAAPNDVTMGDTIPVTIDGQFFSGGTVVDGQVEWAVYATPYVFQPGGNLSRFSFYSPERDTGYYYRYQSTEFIARGEGRTDGSGRFTVDIPAERTDQSSSQTFTIEATITDIAGSAVSGRTSVIVHRSQVYPGIRPSQTVGEAEEEMSFDLTVVDWEGNELPNRTLNVEIVERRWYSVQEENEFGQTVWQTSVEEIPIITFDDIVSDESGRVQVTFTPPNGGVYRAYVRTADEAGREAIASTYVWVSGGDYVPWRRVNDHSFELVTDADSYQPGDTAQILIASPFQGEATALVTVERGHIKEYDVLQLNSNSTIYPLRITGDMAPNIFVSVMVVKGVDETNTSPDFKVGMAQFTVDREEQELSVEITPDRTTLGPRDTVNYTVRVRDHEGNPVDAELSLSVSDLAALSLADRADLPILDYFYSEQWLSVQTSLLLTRIMDDFNQELEAEIKGGGGGGGDAGILTVRENFLDTAYWEGQARTGADGEVSISVPLPDNLTTWRLDVRAVTADTLVGEATTDIVTTRPLLVQPTTPRFFIVGDAATIGTAVHNNSDTTLEATVTLEAEGVTLESPVTQQVTIPPQQQTAVQWHIVVEDVDRVDFVFSASSGDLFDASRPTLGTLEGQGIPVYKYEVPATVGTSGQLLEGGVAVESIGLPIFPDYEATQGEVTIGVTPSLAASMTDGLTYLEHYPYECTEQLISSFLPNVLTLRALRTAGVSAPTLEANLKTQINIALQRLYNRQHSDGGWPWWEESESSTLVTAYVVLGLIEAQTNGDEISPGVIEQGVNYLVDHINEVESLNGRFRWNRQAFIVYVLARAENMMPHVITDLYDQREGLDLYARSFLAQAMLLSNPDDPRLETLMSDFGSTAILSATGSHWEEAERDYWNWNTDTRTTAIVLSTMAKLDPDNPLVANAVRWLMAHRTDGRWAGTQETAWTLMALTDWMIASGELEADYQYEVALNGELLGSGEANTETIRDTLELKVAVTDLFTDELNRLAIGRTDGPGNLYYTTHMQVHIPVEHVQAQDRGIIISRHYYDADDRDTPITEANQGHTFLARITIIVPDTLHYVLIEDFLPAGLEAVDQSLKTSQQVSAPDRYDPDDYFTQGWGWWYFNHVELRDEKVVLSTDYLPRGTYEYVYLVRASTPGEFHVIPPTASEFYFPEVYGRGDGSLFTVR